jgi:type VI secretion system protein ImpF
MMHTVTTQSEATTGSLLDRLSIRSTDQIADATVSRGDLQATSPRESILRNLQWLLNTTRLESSRDLQGWPHIRRSVLNFGIPELSGQYLSSVDSERLELQMAEAIVLFEPRLVPETVQVRVIADDTQTTARALTLVIIGECLPTLGSAAVRLAAHIDLESGRVLKISH